MFQNHKQGHMFSFITGKVLGVFMKIFCFVLRTFSRIEWCNFCIENLNLEIVFAYGWRKPPLHSVGENPKWFACLAGFVGLELTKTAKQNFTLGDETRHLKKLVQIIESTIPKMIDWYNCSILSAFLPLPVQNLPF